MVGKKGKKKKKEENQVFLLRYILRDDGVASNEIVLTLHTRIRLA
jgi:hypothetical protein